MHRPALTGSDIQTLVMITLTILLSLMCKISVSIEVYFNLLNAALQFLPLSLSLLDPASAHALC